MARGVDGLTVEELRSSRAYWDDRFTRELLEGISHDATTLVDVGCGLARAAFELLPHRPQLRYLGVDIDGVRLAAAARDLAGSALGSRTQLLRASGARLPFASGAVDVVLAAVILQHLAAPAALLREAYRVLAPGGAVVAVEPDYAPMQFYFDGPLAAISAGFGDLRAACQEARRPADHNIGPRVPSLLRAVGFGDVQARLHCLQESCARSASDVARDLLETIAVLAATAPNTGHAANRCRASVEQWLGEVGPDASGQYAWFVPVFVVLARKA
jgi:SAM-dependent methyltransferase